MEKFKKTFVFSVMFTMVFSMSMLAVPFSAGATASAGDLIKMDGLSSVYYLGADNKRYVFPNEQTYFSWYSDFSGVVTIPQSELESYPLGANVTIRPGTVLVKITTDPKVYAVQPGGELVWVPDETTASTLFGSNWNQRIVDVPDAFFTNYNVTSGTVSASAYPAGSLVQWEGDSTVYYIASDGTARKVASEAAFTANRWKWDDIIDAPASVAMPTAGADITGAEFTDTSEGAGGTPATPSGTGLTVSLAGTTAPAGTLVAGQAIANLASFNFTASSDGDVTVTMVKLKRLGVSADTTLAKLYLYEGVNRLTDSATVSDGYINWNDTSGVFVVPSGTTRTITVKSDIAASTSGETVAVQIEGASHIDTTGATVSGSFPMKGNTHSIASATLATVDFASTSYPDSDGTPNPQDDFELWRNTLTIGNREVYLEYITLRQIGSVLTDDLQNFELYIAGAKQGDTIARVDADGYITFDFSASPIELTTGTKEFKVLVDIVGGSTRTTSLSVQRAADSSFIDSDYNVPVLATANSSSFSARTSTAQTIAAGALTISKKADSTTSDLVHNGSNVVLGSYEFKATGEKMKVESLRATAIVSDANIDELRNGKIYVNGVQKGSTADLYVYASNADSGTYYTEYTFGSSFIVEPGSPATVEVRADIYDSDGTDHVSNGDTIQVAIASSSNNVQKMTSLSYTSAPSTDKAANTLTVAQGSLTCNKYTGYNNHNLPDPQNKYKIAEFRCTAGTAENLTITAFSVDFDNSAGTVEVADDMTDGYLVYGDTTSVTKATLASTSNSWTVSEPLAAGATLAVSVYGDIESSIATADTLQADLTVSYTRAVTGDSTNASEATGQTLTIAAGDLTSAATEDPLDQIVYGNQTVTTANFEITAQNDDYTVKEICINVNSSYLDAISAVYLYDGSTLLNSGGTFFDASGIATTTGLSWVVPKNTTKTLTTKIALNDIGTGNGTPGRDASTTLSTVYAKDSNGTDKYVNDNREGNKVLVYKSYPVVTYNSLTSTTITNDSSQDVYKFTVTPSAGGSIDMKQFTLQTVWSDLGPVVNNDIELEVWKLYRGTTDITSLVNIVTTGDTYSKVSTTGTTGATTVKGTDGASTTNSDLVVVSWLDGTAETITSATTYTLKATPKNFDSGTTSSDSVSLTMIATTSAPVAGLLYVGDDDGDKFYGLASSATGVTSTTEYYFIWSDRSSIPHSSTSGSSSADWASGFIVDNFDLTTTTLKP